MLKNYAQFSDTEIVLVSSEAGASPSENTWYVNKIPHVVGDRIDVIVHPSTPSDGPNVSLSVPCRILLIDKDGGRRRRVHVWPCAEGVAIVDVGSNNAGYFELWEGSHLLTVKTNEATPTADPLLVEAAMLQAGIEPGPSASSIRAWEASVFGSVSEPNERLPNAMEVFRDETALLQELQKGVSYETALKDSIEHGHGVPTCLVVNGTLILPGDPVEFSADGTVFTETCFSKFVREDGGTWVIYACHPNDPSSDDDIYRIRTHEFLRLPEAARNRRLMAKTVERVETSKGAQAYQSAAGLFCREGNDGWNTERQILEGGTLFGGLDFSGMSQEELEKYDQVSFRLMNIEHAAGQDIELSIGRGEWTTHRILSVIHTPNTTDGSYVVSCEDAGGNPFFVTSRHYLRPTAERRRARLLCLMDASLINQTIGYTQIGETEMREIVCDGQPLNQIPVNWTRNPDAKALDPQELLALDLFGIPHHRTEWVEWLNPVTCIWEFRQIVDIRLPEDGSGEFKVELDAGEDARPMKLMRNARIRTTDARRENIVKQFLSKEKSSNFLHGRPAFRTGPMRAAPGTWVDRPFGRGPIRVEDGEINLSSAPTPDWGLRKGWGAAARAGRSSEFSGRGMPASSMPTEPLFETDVRMHGGPYKVDRASTHAELTATARATSGYGGALPAYSMEELRNATYQGSMALFWMCKDDVKAGDFQDAVKLFATGVETLVLGRPGRGFA